MAAKLKAKHIDLKGVWKLVFKYRRLKKSMDGLFQRFLWQTVAGSPIVFTAVFW